MKQGTFAKQLGVSDTHISQIISRKRRPSYPLAKKLSNALGLDLEMIYETPEKIREKLKAMP